MGAKFGIDKIGLLSHEGGIITLGLPSGSLFNVLTIGGQQYRVGVLQRMISADVSLSTNNRYMVFAVVSGGTVQLRVSENVNSVGPAGFIAWKLVGAFYSNGLSAFGSLVNIKGVPKTTPWLAGGVRLFIGGTLVTNKGNVTIDEVHIRRDGLMMEYEWRFQKDSTGQSLAGNYEAAPPTFGSGPTAYQIDESKIASLVGINYVRTMGIAWWGNSGVAYDLIANYVGGNVLQFAKADGSNETANTVFVNWLGQVIHYYGCKVQFPVSQWNNTPLEDL